MKHPPKRYFGRGPSSTYSSNGSLGQGGSFAKGADTTPASDNVITGYTVATENAISVAFDPQQNIHAQIRADRDRFDPARVPINTYRQYARGHHRMILSDKQKEILRSLLGNRFCDNVCDQVLSSSASRLDVTRFDCQNAVNKKFLDDWFNLSSIKSVSRDVHYNSSRDGNTILALNWDNDKKRVCLYQEEWWDGYQGVFVAYTSTGDMLYGVKEWVVSTISAQGGTSQLTRRRNVWFPDRLERYTGMGMTWNPAPLPEDDGAWPIPWEDKKGRPLGIPYVHFANSGKGEKYYGVSDIDGVLGLQDQLNDLQFAMSAAGRITAFQMFFATGVADKDENGKKVEYEASPGKIFTTPKTDARMTPLPAGDLSQLISLYDKKQSTIAIRTRTPIYEITAQDLPSGEAIFQAQQPAIAKAQENIDKWSPRWTEVAVMAVKLTNRYGNEPQMEEDPEKAMITTVMAPADRRDKLTMSVVVQNLSSVISNQEALRLLGYSPDQVDQIMQEKSDEGQQAAMDAMSAFNAGTAPGTSLPGKGPNPDPKVPAVGVKPLPAGSGTSGTSGKGAQGGVGPKTPAVGAGTGKGQMPAGGKTK